MNMFNRNKGNEDNVENKGVENEQGGVQNNGADSMNPEAGAQTEETLKNQVGKEIKGDEEVPAKTPPAPEKKPEATEKKDVVAGIADKLGEGGKEEATKSTVNPIETMPFDITKLTMEQRQAMKAMLDATPDSVSKKVENPKIRIRKFEGKYIVNFKRAYLGLVRDHDNNRDVERHMIPVLYKDEKEYTKVLYANFINSEQVECEVVKQLQEPKKFIEGQTFNRKTGRMVEVVRTELHQTFIIELPDNEGKITIEGKMANA